MIKYVNISTEDFFYTLPESRIAKYPLEKRDRSKLLVFRNGLEMFELFMCTEFHVYIFAENQIYIDHHSKQCFVITYLLSEKIRLAFGQRAW